MATGFSEWATLPGSEDGILSLSFSPGGKYLAVTGYAGVAIWDIAENRSLPFPSLPVDAGGRNLYTRSTWLFFQETCSEVLVLGSKRGDLHLWRWDAAQNSFVRARSFKNARSPSEVLSMDVYRPIVPVFSQGMVVAAMASHQILLLAITPQNRLTEVFSVMLDQGCRPQTVRFNTFAHTVMVFALTGGIILHLDCETGAKVGGRTDGPQIMASVAVDPLGQRFVAYTGQALEVVSMCHTMASQTIFCEHTDFLYPMHVAFAGAGEVLVVGTDKGRAMLYDMSKPSKSRALNYPRGGLVQQVAACTTNKYHIIAYAGSSIKKPADVILYRKKLPRGSRGLNFCGLGKYMLVLTGIYLLTLSALLLYRFVL